MRGLVALSQFPNAEIVTLNSSSTYTSSWTGSGVEVTKYSEAYIIADITSFDRGDGDELLTLEIEGSFDNSSWFHRYTFVDEENEGDLTTLTGDADRGKLKATGKYHAYLKGGLGKYLRVKGTVEGTTPSITLEVKGSFK